MTSKGLLIWEIRYREDVPAVRPSILSLGSRKGDYTTIVGPVDVGQFGEGHYQGEYVGGEFRRAMPGARGLWRFPYLYHNCYSVATTEGYVEKWTTELRPTLRCIVRHVVHLHLVGRIGGSWSVPAISNGVTICLPRTYRYSIWIANDDVVQ